MIMELLGLMLLFVTVVMTLNKSKRRKRYKDLQDSIHGEILEKRRIEYENLHLTLKEGELVDRIIDMNGLSIDIAEESGWMRVGNRRRYFFISPRVFHFTKFEDLNLDLMLKGLDGSGIDKKDFCSLWESVIFGKHIEKYREEKKKEKNLCLI